MALATQCPHCGTQFRVAADQLKLRGGIVRCGACQQIFDGNSALIDLAAGPAPVVAAPADAPADESPTTSSPPVDETPVETLAPVSEPVAPQEPDPEPAPM
ncbi:MAG: zinc-ribbon domain-containing protein, partial [Massilia sp.]